MESVALYSDYIDKHLMAKLTENGIKFITLPSQGYDYVNGTAAKNSDKVLLEHLNTHHQQLLSLGCT